MEKPTKPENLFIRRRRLLTALAAAACIAAAVGVAVAYALAEVNNPPETEGTFIFLTVAVSVMCAIVLFIAVLNFRNLFFPYILTADEKGIYNYSGFFHFGFIAWEDILSFTKDATLLDLLDNEQPCLKISVTAEFKSAMSFKRKWLKFWSGGNIKIYTMCSEINRKQLFALLSDMLAYYNAPDGMQVDNGQ